MSNQQSGIDWAKAITAGAVATVAITIVGMFMKMDMMKMLGAGMVGEDGGAMVYVIGGIMHFMIGLFYGVVFAVLSPKVPLPPVVSGLIFGAVLAPIAMFTSPVMSGMMPYGSADNPCGGNPCGGSNPCGQTEDNPCGQTEDNPCGQTEDNPCGQTADNPCNPCNPCGGGGGMNPWVGSFINHLVFGLVLGLMYKPKGA